MPRIIGNKNIYPKYIVNYYDDENRFINSEEFSSIKEIRDKLGIKNITQRNIYYGNYDKHDTIRILPATNKVMDRLWDLRKG